MNGKITINIPKEDTSQFAPINQPMLNNNLNNSFRNQAINATLINYGMQLFQVGTSLYGEISGDYMTQTDINNAMGLAGDALLIARGGPLGIAAVAYKRTMQAVNLTISNKKQQQILEFQKSRLGTNAINGSRFFK